MDNFDYKKYLSKNPLTEAYTPGSGWTQDFDYDDMLAHGLKLNANSPIEDLEKVFADFEDVNYHREGEPLSYAIDAIKAGDRGEAKMYINKFHKELKKTIADYSDEYFDVNEEKLHENMFDVATTEKIAQAVADAFTADDELDLKYVVNPRIDPSSFDLDVEAGPNTPGEDWKDAGGFSIDNYLGEFAGGSFYIKDGVVYNAASRNAPVANVTPEGEVEMISAEDSRAAIGMEENKEETKSNKMKKSELKEMIRNAFLNETEIEEIDMLEAEEEEKEEVEVEDTEEIDVDTDAETADAGEVDVEADAEVEMTGDTKSVQDNLEAALEAAKALGDQKLVDQIGNSITFFTRTHVVGNAEVAEASVDVEVDSPVEDAEVGMKLEESINRMKKLAGLIK
jgi:hypothetical protein